jgi:hypothetical protein
MVQYKITLVSMIALLSQNGLRLGMVVGESVGHVGVVVFQ